MSGGDELREEARAAAQGAVDQLTDAINDLRQTPIRAPTPKRGAANLGREAYARLKAELAQVMAWREQKVEKGQRIRATKGPGRDDRRIAEAESRRLTQWRSDRERCRRRIEARLDALDARKAARP